MGGSQDPHGKEAVPTVILSRKVAGVRVGRQRGAAASPQASSPGARGTCGSARRGTGDAQAVHSLVPAAGSRSRGWAPFPLNEKESGGAGEGGGGKQIAFVFLKFSIFLQCLTHSIGLK